MADADRADLERVAADFVAAVERLWQRGENARVEVDVNGRVRSASAPRIVRVEMEKAA